MSHQIQLKRKLAATPDEVYEAWTDAKSLMQWMVPIVGGRTEVHADAREGGSLRITMFGLNGHHIQDAKYLRLERPHLVEFAWTADPAQPQGSIVTVELKAIGSNHTELTLTHKLLPNEASAQGHQTGWDSGLDSLMAHINRAESRHFRKEVHFKASAAALYAALSTEAGLRGWWTQTCTVGTQVGEQIRFEFGDTYKVMRIDTLRPERQVRWHVLESHIHVEDRNMSANEWTGTTVVFRINEGSPTHTVLRFEHLGLTPQLQCYELCEGGWNNFLQSLQQYVETGIGTPYLKDAGACHAQGKVA